MSTGEIKGIEGRERKRKELCQFSREKLIFYWLSSTAWWQERKFSVRTIDLFNGIWKCFHDKHTSKPHFITLHFIALGRHCAFYKLKVCGSPASSTSVHHVSDSIFSLHVSVSHFGKSCSVSIFFLISLYSLWWSVISDFFLCYYCIVLEYPPKMMNLTDKCCVCSDCSTKWPFFHLSLPA